jgi:hypothetical protein
MPYPDAGDTRYRKRALLERRCSGESVFYVLRKGDEWPLLCNSNITQTIPVVGAAFAPNLMDAREERVRASAMRWRVAERRSRATIKFNPITRLVDYYSSEV